MICITLPLRLLLLNLMLHSRASLFMGIFYLGFLYLKWVFVFCKYSTLFYDSYRTLDVCVHILFCRIIHFQIKDICSNLQGHHFPTQNVKVRESNFIFLCYCLQCCNKLFEYVWLFLELVLYC
jgi:hypothetical protein